MTEKGGLLFRVMHPRGRYPLETVSCEDGMLAQAFWRSYVFSVVRQTEHDEHQSEVCWALPSEIRFWASIALAYKESPLSMCMYPSVPGALPFSTGNFDDLFIWKVALHFDKTYLGAYVSQLGCYERRKDVFDPQIQTVLMGAIDLGDSVLIRGLSAFLKANVLCYTDRLFMEEATLLMFFAMESTLEIARRRLEQSGVQNPAFDDAIEYVASGVAPKDAALEYFRECYDKRVVLVHPSNRVTSDIVPLLWADDFYDNYEIVADTYRRLLLGGDDDTASPEPGGLEC